MRYPHSAPAKVWSPGEARERRHTLRATLLDLPAARIKFRPRRIPHRLVRGPCAGESESMPPSPPGSRFLPWRFARFVLVTLAVATVSAGGVSVCQEPPVDLTVIGIEAVMDMEVTSVSKRPEKLMEATAAIYVLTSEDIRRSGATSIPELLRLVPGVQVARIDSNKWAVGVRGFASRLSRSLLVLIDGRSVYDPLFAGTYWEVQDTLLEDVDRIEVIRGPGATLWGANAVNGVINIITKHAKDTHGLFATAGGGNEERVFGGVRYGGKVGEHLYYRAYAKGFDRDGG